MVSSWEARAGGVAMVMLTHTSTHRLLFWNGCSAAGPLDWVIYIAFLKKRSMA
jgi:hypothetical protein